MTFFNRLSKGVGKAAEQAKFEADKALRLRRIGAEVTQIESQISGAVMAAGRQAIEQRLPGLEEIYASYDELTVQLEAKNAELEAARAEQWVDDEAPAAAPLGAAPAAGGAFCPNCGSSVTPGAKFCPSCGNKMS